MCYDLSYGSTFCSCLRGLIPANQISNADSHTLLVDHTLAYLSIHIGPVPPQFREKGPRQAGAKREEDPKTLPDVR